MKCYFAFALIILIVLVATGVWNPFPDLWEWANTREPLSAPDVTWQQRLGGSPKSVTVAGDAVVVERRTKVEARSLSTGVQLWERKADWGAVAGDGQDSVVVVGKLLVKGYEVLDPLTGAVRRRDSQAVAVWSYRNALLDVRCFDARECVLTAWQPKGSQPLWKVDLPGIGFVLFADNPETLGTSPLTTSEPEIQPDAGGPTLMPALMGLPIDGRVYVVDTAAGRVVRDFEPNRKERVVTVGGRLLRVRALASYGTCYFTVTAYDPATDQRVWQQTGLNLRTTDRAGCAQNHDPPGGQYVVVGVTPDVRETVIEAYGGRRLWTGSPRERLLAVDDKYAVARSADGKTISGYEFPSSSARWSRPAQSKTQAALTPYAALVVDHDQGRVAALDPRTGRELVSLRSSATVLAVGPAGLIIGSGREIGYARFGSTDSRSGTSPGQGSNAPDPGGDVPDPGGGVPDPGSSPNPGGGGTCGGPKHEKCVPA